MGSTKNSSTIVLSFEGKNLDFMCVTVFEEADSFTPWKMVDAFSAVLNMTKEELKLINAQNTNRKNQLSNLINQIQTKYLLLLGLGSFFSHEIF